MTTVRRQRLSPDARRDQIVAAAVAVLAENGYQAASADAIARQAGVSKGLLWHYFANRDELMEQTARRTLVTLRAAVGDQIDLTAPAPDVIRSAVRAAASLRRTHAAERRAISEVVNNLRTPEGGSRFSLRDYEPLYSEQEEIFRRGQRDGDFRPELDPRVLAVAYQGAVDAMLGYLDAHPRAAAERYATGVADVLLGGICSP